MLMQRAYTLDGFRRVARESSGLIVAGGKGIMVRAGVVAEVERAADDAARSMQFTISTETIDRMNDTIDVTGWKLDNFRKNPVVLYGHDGSALPVGKAPRVWIEGKSLKAEVEFTPAGMARFNDTVFDMLKGGFLNAVSVGFAPLKWAWAKAPDRPMGIDFIEQELLEFSIVTIPANPEALVDESTRAADPAKQHDEPTIDPLANYKHRIEIERLRA